MSHKFVKFTSNHDGEFYNKYLEKMFDENGISSDFSYLKIPRKWSNRKDEHKYAWNYQDHDKLNQHG